MGKINNFSASYRALTPLPTGQGLPGGGQVAPAVDFYNAVGDVDSNLDTGTGIATLFTSGIIDQSGEYLPSDFMLKIPTAFVTINNVTQDLSVFGLRVDLSVGKTLLPTVGSNNSNYIKVGCINLNNGANYGLQTVGINSSLPDSQSLDLSVTIPVGDSGMPQTTDLLLVAAYSENSNRISEYFISKPIVGSMQTLTSTRDWIVKITKVAKLTNSYKSFSISYFNLGPDITVPVTGTPFRYMMEIRTQPTGPVNDPVNCGIALTLSSATVTLVNPNLVPGRRYYVVVRDWADYYLSQGSQNPSIVSNIVEIIAPELSMNAQTLYET